VVAVVVVALVEKVAVSLRLAAQGKQGQITRGKTDKTNQLMVVVVAVAAATAATVAL
jgi:hypothetical protein